MHRGQSLGQGLDQEETRFGWMKSNASVSRRRNVFWSQTAGESSFGFPFLKGLGLLLLPPGLDSNPSDIRRGAVCYAVLWYWAIFHAVFR